MVRFVCHSFSIKHIARKIVHIFARVKPSNVKSTKTDCGNWIKMDNAIHQYCNYGYTYYAGQLEYFLLCQSSLSADNVKSANVRQWVAESLKKCSGQRLINTCSGNATNNAVISTMNGNKRQQRNHAMSRSTVTWFWHDCTASCCKDDRRPRGLEAAGLNSLHQHKYDMMSQTH